MTKESDRCLAKLTLLLVQGYLGRLDAIEGCFKTGTVLLLIFPVDEDVVHEAHDAREAFKDLAHPSLEVLWGTGYPEWHFV